jgi:hypothetical protein
VKAAESRSNPKEQQPGESLTAYDERRADENERDAIDLPIREAALCQIKHVAHDGLVEIEGKRWISGFQRWRRTRLLLEEILSIAEGCEPDSEFLYLYMHPEVETWPK